MATAAIQQKRVGLEHWMEEVVIQCTNVERDFNSDSVHDLRTSLRRCRSMADGMMVFDPGRAWKKMKKSGRNLFRSLGALRDAQVMQEWVEKLAPENDPAAIALRTALRSREEESRQLASVSLRAFDGAQWSGWKEELSLRAQRVSPGSLLFAHLALERLYQARALHRRALRNRTKVAFHDLRIGIKRLRYTVENFLPALHHSWGRDLKQLQDILGEVHDLDVLWQTMLQAGVFADTEARESWRSRIEKERSLRLEEYRKRMTGAASLWRVWRAGLPGEPELRRLGFERLKTWASFLDPDPAHSRHVSRLALEIYDGLTRATGIDPGCESQRRILHLASLTHDIGHAVTTKGHHKASARLVRQIPPPLGWTSEDLQLAALVARYHRGAVPQETQKLFSSLALSNQAFVKFLGGILRLACACDHEHDQQISTLRVESTEALWTIRAQGYRDATSLAQRIAGARYLLELACRRPVCVSSPAFPAA